MIGAIASLEVAASRASVRGAADGPTECETAIVIDKRAGSRERGETAEARVAS